MKPSTKEKIKTLHSNHPEIQKDIEGLFPKLFPNNFLETGKWYTNGVILVCYTELSIKENSPFGACYGFQRGNWFGNDERYGRHLISATESEVKEALIKECEKRNLTIENLPTIKCLDGFNKPQDSDPKYNLESAEYYWEYRANKLWIQNGGFTDCCVFHNGKFATVIQPKEITLSEALEKLKKVFGEEVVIVKE